MKKRTIFTCCLLLSLFSVQAKNHKPAVQTKNYAVSCIAFYNLENLFDTIDDPAKDDAEFLPDGAYHWTSKKYQEKLRHMSYAISQLGRGTTPQGPVCLGVAEVENIGCLQDLVKQPALADRHYEPILLEGPDRRGVDVGFLYQPDRFTPTNIKGYTLQAHYADGGVVRSRYQLLVSGYLNGDKIHFLVCHWPSRYGGELSSRATRDTAAMLTMHIVDSLIQREPKAKVVVMGDLNDDPTNHSCKDILGASLTPDNLSGAQLYNTMWHHLENGVGTLSYQGAWNLFDQIIITANLANAPHTELSYWKSEVGNYDFLTTQDGKYKGSPFRTTSGGVWQNGYSDHYPTMIYLIKQK